MSAKITSSYFNGNGCPEIHLPRSRSYNIKSIHHEDQLLRQVLKLSLKYGNSLDRTNAHKFRVEASSSSSPSPSPSPWKKWLLGIFLTVILPAIGHKGGVLLALKGKIDQAIQTVEHVTEAVEEIAEEAEKIMEEVEEKLPGDSKIKKALDSFEDLAEKAVKEAKIAEDTIHKMKEVEEEIEEALVKAGKDNEANTK